ncbi:D-amino acid aminotransferase [soil metagenome]
MLVLLNGELVPHDAARISIFDRGFIFGDGIYEGLRAIAAAGSPTGTRLIAPRLHAARMQHALDEVRIPFTASSLIEKTLDLLAANRLTDAFVYWHVSRGTPDLAAGPARSRTDIARLTPTVMAFCTPLPPLDFHALPATRRAATAPDVRWSLGHLKSTSLLGNVVAALAGAADETILIRDPEGAALVSEGTYTNVAAVLKSSAGATQIVTPSLESTSILNGVTRAILLLLVPEIIARPVTVAELRAADEIMLWGTTTLVASITHLDGRAVGSGGSGPVAGRMLLQFLQFIQTHRDSTIDPQTLEWGPRDNPAKHPSPSQVNMIL